METTGRPGANLSINREFVRKILVEFIRDETRNAGFERGIVGLSGGVDSAVCAFLAAEAFGHENVIAVMMPYRT
ncbi:MAG: NAD(+) synthetase, partial [Bacteroidota bacterium]